MTWSFLEYQLHELRIVRGINGLLTWPAAAVVRACRVFHLHLIL